MGLIKKSREFFNFSIFLMLRGQLCKVYSKVVSSTN